MSVTIVLIVLINAPFSCQILVRTVQLNEASYYIPVVTLMSEKQSHKHTQWIAAIYIYIYIVFTLILCPSQTTSDINLPFKIAYKLVTATMHGCSLVYRATPFLLCGV